MLFQNVIRCGIFYFSIFFPISTNIGKNISIFISFLTFRYCRLEVFILLNLTTSAARNKIFSLSHVSVLSNYSWLLLLDASSNISSKDPCLWHISLCSYHSNLTFTCITQTSLKNQQYNLVFILSTLPKLLLLKSLIIYC